jgi:ferredoxin
VQGEVGQTLLDVAESHGLDIPSLCRAGVCGTCRTRVVDGEVDCSSATLDAADREAGYVLACVASPRGDCAIEA